MPELLQILQIMNPIFKVYFKGPKQVSNISFQERKTYEKLNIFYGSFKSNALCWIYSLLTGKKE